MKRLLLTIGTAGIAMFATQALAQSTYPTRTVSMVVGFAPGGGTDTVARIIAKDLSGRLGQQVIVENRDGAGGNIATDMVVKATKTKAWGEALEKNGWTPALLAGADFEKFVDDEFASLRAVMVKSGMV